MSRSSNLPKIGGEEYEWRWYRGENNRWTLHKVATGEQVGEIKQYMDGDQVARMDGKILFAAYLTGVDSPLGTDVYIPGVKWLVEEQLKERLQG